MDTQQGNPEGDRKQSDYVGTEGLSEGVEILHKVTYYKVTYYKMKNKHESPANRMICRAFSWRTRRDSNARPFA